MQLYSWLRLQPTICTHCVYLHVNFQRCPSRSEHIIINLDRAFNISSYSNDIVIHYWICENLLCLWLYAILYLDIPIFGRNLSRKEMTGWLMYFLNFAQKGINRQRYYITGNIQNNLIFALFFSSGSSSNSLQVF